MPPIEPLPSPAPPVVQGGWWLTTVAGAIGAALLYVSGMLPEPWNKVAEALAGVISIILGYSHPGLSLPRLK